MLDFKRRKTLEEYGGNEHVKNILESMEGLRKDDSTEDIRSLINVLSRTYNLYISLPHELLSYIFEYLSLEDILKKRSIFLDLQKESQPNTYSLDQIRSYCIMRYNTENIQKAENVKQLNTLEEVKEVNFMVFEEKYCTLGSTDLEEKFIDYYIWMKNLEFLKVTIITSKRIQKMQKSTSSSSRFRIIVNSKELCEYIFLKDEESSILRINRKCIQKLERMNYLKYIIEKNIILSPKKTDGILWGDFKDHNMETVSGMLPSTPVFRKLVILVLSFIEVIRWVVDEQPHGRGSVYAPGDYFYGFRHLSGDNVFIKLSEVGHGISYEDFNNNKLTLFENDDLDI